MLKKILAWPLTNCSHDDDIYIASMKSIDRHCMSDETHVIWETIGQTSMCYGNASITQWKVITYENMNILKAQSSFPMESKWTISLLVSKLKFWKPAKIVCVFSQGEHIYLCSTQPRSYEASFFLKSRVLNTCIK